MKILLIDDDFFFQKGLSFFLMELGHSVLFAMHGQKAIELIIRNKNIDLIICDIEMPVLKGTDFLRSLENYFENTPPIIVVSGITDGAQLLNEQGISYNYFFNKPLNVNLFEEALKELNR